MALARKSQMLQASFCLLALVAFSTILPSHAQAPTAEFEDLLDDLDMPLDSIAESPMAESPLAESPEVESLDAESPEVEALAPAQAPLSESTLGLAPEAEGPVADIDLEEEIARGLDEIADAPAPSAEELPLESSAGIATMGAVIIGVMFSAAIGVVV